MNLTLVTVVLLSTLFNNQASAAMNHGDDMANVYCVKKCSSNNPCGDKMGQSTRCLSITFDNATEFGFEDENKTDEFLGCSHTICTDACSGMEVSSKINIINGTFCFPKMQEMNDMFMTKDLAKMAAVSRGCEGAHEMGGGKFMVGDDHDACVKSYSKSGVTLGGDDSSSSSVLMTFGAVAFGMFILAINAS